MNNNGKIMSFLKNKNTVTALCAILIVIILIVAYQIRVNNATKPIMVPFAKVTIQPRTLITADLVEYKKVPAEALGGNYIGAGQMNALINSGEIFTNVNTVIPAGSLFYTEALTKLQDLPDTALYNVPEGETLYYLTIDMLTSFQNSILPGNYIDLYVSYRDESQAIIGKLFSNIKVLAVKTSDGKNVFENSDESRVPYVILFSLKEEDHLLLREIDAINQYNLSTIRRIPVPTNVGYQSEAKNVETYVSSTTIKEYINTLALAIDEDVRQDLTNETDVTDNNSNSGDDTAPVVNPFAVSPDSEDNN